MPRLTALLNPRRSLAPLLAIVIGLFVLSACTSSHDGSGQSKESKTGQADYDKLVAKQPAHDMTYSPTRNTVNFFIDTWGKNPNKLSYVYLQNADGKLVGYFVFRGLPVNYCVSLRPNYKIYKDTGDGNGGNLLTPAPSADGVYYGAGAGCNTYYGKDAQTGAYIEYTVGNGQNVLLFDQPLTNHQNVPKLAPPAK